MRALGRAHQQGEQIPLSVWSVCNLISLALEPLQSESEESVRAVNAELNDENENKEETQKILGERPHSHESPTGRYESLGTLYIESLFPEEESDIEKDSEMELKRDTKQFFSAEYRNSTFK